MTWLTWRQFRAQAWTAVVALALIAIAFAVTGPHLADLYNSSGLPTCVADGNCQTLRTTFIKQVTADPLYTVLYFLGLATVYLAPALIGMFWGAPLLTRELEARTVRLAWTQSVTRTRWLVTKLGLVGMAAMATAGLFSLIVTWWASPIDQADALPGDGEALPNRFVPLIFGARDIAPIGYAAFAVALGVTVGVLIRRTLPAMAITLALFAAVQIVMPMSIRSHLIPPDHATTALDTAAVTRIGIVGDNGMTVSAAVNIPGAWIISTHTITPAGQPFTGPPPPGCKNATSPQICEAAIAELHLRQLVTYQPASRYWAFQWYETGIYLALAAALAGLSARRIRRIQPA
jgi:hypothetical protein